MASIPSRNRVGPVIAVIIVLAVLAILAPVLAKLRTDPVTWVTEIMNATQSNKPNIELKHSVWVNMRSGLYYCRQSKFYGRMRPGLPMRQGNALQRGYRPAEGQFCP